MKYRLNDLISVSQRLTLVRWANPQKTQQKVEFVKLEPGYWYDAYADDELYIQSLKDWKVTLRSTPALLEALDCRGIPYTTKKGCPCSGGKPNVTFPGIEVVDG